MTLNRYKKTDFEISRLKVSLNAANLRKIIRFYQPSLRLRRQRGLKFIDLNDGKASLTVRENP